MSWLALIPLPVVVILAFWIVIRGVFVIPDNGRDPNWTYWQ